MRRRARYGRRVFASLIAHAVVPLDLLAALGSGWWLGLAIAAGVLVLAAGFLGFSARAARRRHGQIPDLSAAEAEPEALLLSAPRRRFRLRSQRAPLPDESTVGVIRERPRNGAGGAPPPEPPVPPPEVEAPAEEQPAAEAEEEEAEAPPVFAIGGGGAPPPPPPPGGDEDERDPPRSAYALLQAPNEVVVDQEFELTVGLAAEQEAGVAGRPIERPPTSVGAYALTIDVDTDGFELREGETWRNDLRVTSDEPYPDLTLHLTAESQADEVRTTKIEATFAVDGQTIGLAVRFLAVRSTPEAVSGPPTGVSATGVTMSIPSSETAPDLTIRIRRWHSESGGRLRWSVESPHPVLLPEPSEGDIGAEPQRFAEQLVKQMTMREGKRGCTPA